MSNGPSHSSSSTRSSRLSGIEFNYWNVLDYWNDWNTWNGWNDLSAWNVLNDLELLERTESNSVVNNDAG